MSKRIAGLAEGLEHGDGACLRYIVSTRDQPVEPTRLTNSIEWSPLPHSYTEARRVLSKLEDMGLIEKKTQKGFSPIELGNQVIVYANKHDLYRSLATNPTSRRNY